MWLRQLVDLRVLLLANGLSMNAVIGFHLVNDSYSIIQRDHFVSIGTVPSSSSGFMHFSGNRRWSYQFQMCLNYD